MAVSGLRSTETDADRSRKNRQTPGGFFSPVALNRTGAATVNIRTDDLRIREIRELTTPEDVMHEHAITPQISVTVAAARSAVHRSLHGQDDRLAVVLGPRYFHDVDSALEYAGRLAEQRERLEDSLEIIMR